MSVDWEAIHAEEIRLFVETIKTLRAGYESLLEESLVSEGAYTKALASLPPDVSRAAIELRHMIYQAAQAVVA